MTEPLISIEKMQKFIEAALEHYHHAPGWFTDWLEDLYLRLQSDLCSIPLVEVCTLSALYDEAGWMPETLAVNRIYKLFDRLGRNTTGIAGF